MTAPIKQPTPLARIEAVFGWRGFPDALFYSAKHALRFDLGGDDEDAGVALRFARAMGRATAVAEAAFAGAGALTAVVSHYGVRGLRAARPDAASLRTLRELGFEGRFGPGDLAPRDAGEPIPTDPEDDVRGYWFAAEFPNAPKPLAALLWATVADEMAVEPKVRWVHRAYIVDFARGVAVHAYDDRGMDVIATDPARLAPLYARFGDWLLDYARADMDGQFGGEGG